MSRTEASPTETSPRELEPRRASRTGVSGAVVGVRPIAGLSPPTGAGLTVGFRFLTGRLINPLLVLALVTSMIIGVQVATTQPAAAQSCGNIPLLSDACDLATDPFEWAGDAIVGVGGELIVGAFDYFAEWVATAAVGALGLLADAMESTTTPNIAGASATHTISLGIARQMAVPLLVLTGLYALLKREAGVILKAAFLYLPGSVIGMVAAAWFTDQLIAAVDAFSADYAGGGEEGIRAFADSVAGQITAGVGITSPALLVVFSVVLILATIMVWMVFLIRAAAILVAYAFMPIAFAGILFPATRGWIRRLIEVQLSFILSKMVIVGIFALGAEVLTGADNALAGMMQASALFVLAAFSPFALMKLLPFVSNEAMDAMERPAGTPIRVATAAAGTAGGLAIYRHLQGSQTEGGGSGGGGGAAGGSTGGGTTQTGGGGGGSSASGSGGGGAAGGAASGAGAAVQAGAKVANAGAGAASGGLRAQPASSGGSGGSSSQSNGQLSFEGDGSQ